MFTYCLNNPVVYLDPGGTSATFFVKDAARAVLTFLTSSKYPQHDVPLYNQGNNPTCWAVCQIMVECYYNNTRLTQSDAEKKVNELVDQALGPLKAYGSGWFPLNRGRKLKIKNIYDLEKHISAGPLYAFYQGPYVDVGDGATKKGAHCVVVTGVDTQNNLVFTNTPWGNKGIQTFEQFQQGFYDANEDNHMTLQSVWEAKYVRWD